MKQPKRSYSTPQEILYTVCLAAWNLCSQYLQKFSSLKAFYTETFIANAQQAVQDAKNLPENRQTTAARKEARINLIQATSQVRVNWQLLKVYITKAFDESMVKTKLDAAGAALYARASVDNWSAVRSLIDAANIFITNNLDDLTASENMPADFQATFKTVGDNCIALSVLYSRVDMDKQMATGIKVDANNAIYDAAIEMLKDGQQIFKDNVIIKKQFTFSYLVSIHRGEGSASLKGNVINDLGLPVEGVVILSQDGKYSATANKKGHYKISRIAAGAYVFNITCPGYSPISQTITFAAGTASKGDFEMKSLMKKVA